MRAEYDPTVLIGTHDVVVEPAQLQLLPCAEVAGARTDAFVVLGRQPALRHQRPELDAVVAAEAVVQVGQAEVVAVLVGEHADAAVLRLHRVVADPDAGVADLAAAERVVGRSAGADRGGLGVPAMRPDGVLALVRIAVGLVASGVHDLEVVDVAVGLVEVAVTVVVVAIPAVERLELLLDLGGRTTLLLLVVDPGVHGVLDEVPDVAAVGVLADGRVVAFLAVGDRVVAAAVTRLVVRHLDPVRDRSVDAVATGRLTLVVRLDRLGLLAGAGLRALPEVDVLEVLTAVVGLPDRRVVLAAVGFGDRVVRRALERRRPGCRGVEVLVGEVLVPLVTELDEHREDAVGRLPVELDVLSVALLLGGPLAVGVDRGGVLGGADAHDRARAALFDAVLAVTVQQRRDRAFA